MDKEPRTASKVMGQKDLLTHWVLVIPVFLFYHLGLLVSPRAANGVDFFTRNLGKLLGLSWAWYLAVMLLFILLYIWILRHLSRSEKFQIRRFPMVVVESTAYALLMGPVANLLLQKIHVLGLVETLGPIDRLVASAGAGFYEELVFRLLAIGIPVGLFLVKRKTGWKFKVLVVLLSSLMFSLAHYIGAGSDPWEFQSFCYRAVLGIFLSLIFLFRGFAPAVYAHFLYDVYVMWFLMS